MRKIISLIKEFALEDQKPTADRMALINEAYTFIDRQIGNDEVAFTDSLAEALVVGDFPNYFDRVLSRKVMARYAMQMGGWRQYTYMDTVPDYTIAERYQFSEFDRPVIRYEKSEPRAGYIEEETVRQLQVSDYAKQIDFSHRILVNDDLGAFNNVTNKMADSVRMFLDWMVSSYYDNATTQAALVALGANYSGTGRLTTANLAIAWNAFTQRVDGRGNALNVRPRYLVIPPILELQARQILESVLIAELATNAKNVLNGALEIVIDPYIAFTAPNIPWYLFADPAAVAAVTVVKLQSRPDDFYLYAKAPDKQPLTIAGGLGRVDWKTGSFLTGDIELSVETTLGRRTDSAALVGVTDANGIYYSSGTTP